MTAFATVEHNRAAEEVTHDEKNLQIITEEIERDLQLESELVDCLFVVAPAVHPVVEDTCWGCGQVYGPAHKCDECGSNMNSFCGHPIGEEGHRQIIGYRICNKQ